MCRPRSPRHARIIRKPTDWACGVKTKDARQARKPTQNGAPSETTNGATSRPHHDVAANKASGNITSGTASSPHQDGSVANFSIDTSTAAADGLHQKPSPAANLARPDAPSTEDALKHQGSMSSMPSAPEAAVGLTLPVHDAQREHPAAHPSTSQQPPEGSSSAKHTDPRIMSCKSVKLHKQDAGASGEDVDTCGGDAAFSTSPAGSSAKRPIPKDPEQHPAETGRPASGTATSGVAQPFHTESLSAELGRSSSSSTAACRIDHGLPEHSLTPGAGGEENLASAWHSAAPSTSTLKMATSPAAVTDDWFDALD